MSKTRNEYSILVAKPYNVERQKLEGTSLPNWTEMKMALRFPNDKFLIKGTIGGNSFDVPWSVT
jgi:hypothetical protein